MASSPFMPPHSPLHMHSVKHLKEIFNFYHLLPNIKTWKQIKLTYPNLHHLYSYIHPCTYLEESNNDFRNTFCWNICIPTFSKLTVDVLCLDRQNKKAKNDKKLHLCDVVSVFKSRMRIWLSLQDHLYIFRSHTVYVIWSFLNSNVVELYHLTIHKSWGMTRSKAP